MNNGTSIYSKSIKKMILNNSLTDKKTHLVGKYKGFNISIRMLLSEPQIVVVINAKNDNDTNNINVNNFLRNNIKYLKDVINVYANANSITLLIKRPFKGKNVPDLINHNIEYVINCLMSNGYITCCSNCGSKNVNIDCYQINDNYYYLCNTCMLQVDHSYKERKIQRQNVETNILKGTIGAIIGALIGIIVWLIFYKLGVIASFGGFAIAYGTLIGFEKISKNTNRKSVIVCIIIMIIAVWLANRFAWSLNAYSTLKYNYTFVDCFMGLNELLEYNNYTSHYIIELVVGYLLTALGSYKFIIKTLREVNGNYSIKKTNI